MNHMSSVRFLMLVFVLEPPFCFMSRVQFGSVASIILNNIMCLGGKFSVKTVNN